MTAAPDTLTTAGSEYQPLATRMSWLHAEHCQHTLLLADLNWPQSIRDLSRTLTLRACSNELRRLSNPPCFMALAVLALSSCWLAARVYCNVQHGSIALRCVIMHCLALHAGTKPRYRYTDPGLLAAPCTLVHPRSRSRYTVQTWVKHPQPC